MTAQVDILKKNFVEGDVITITFTFTHSDGTLYDFSAVTKAWFTIKDDYDKSDTDALVALNSVSHPSQVTYGSLGPGAGKASVKMVNTNTVNLAQHKRRYYDFQVLNGGDIATLVRGEIKFVHEVTLATS